MQKLLAEMAHWTQNTQTQAEVEVFVLDRVHELLPEPPFTAEEKQAAAKRIYEFLWQRSMSGVPFDRAAA